MEKIRVAFEATALLGSRSGVGEFAYGLLTRLSDGDTEVDAFAVSWRKRHLLEGELPLGVGFIDRVMPARPLHLLWDIIDAPKIELILGGGYDIVHGSNFFVPPSRSAKRVVTVHDLTPLHFPEMCLAPVLKYPRYIAKAIADGVFIHTPTEFVKREVMEVFGASEDQVFAVPHGVPTDAYGTLDGVSEGFVAKIREIAAGRKVLLAIGTIEPRKGYVEFLSAFSLLQQRRKDLVLIVAGAKGWGWDSFEAKRSTLVDSSAVVALGWVSAAERKWLYDNATVLVFPSIYEGFGLPALEAMARRLPVICSDAGATEEVVGDCGVIVKGNDPVLWSDAVEEVIDDTEIRTDLSNRGKIRAETFTWEKSASEMRIEYRKILESHG